MNLTSTMVPPHNLEAEKALLGSLLLEGNLFEEVLPFLTEGDFYYPPHQLIWKAMVGTHQKGLPIDMVTVTDFLKNQGWLEQVGSTGYIAELAQTASFHVHPQAYAQIIKEKGLLRQVIQTCQSLIQQAFQENVDLPQFLDWAESQFYRLSQRRLESDLTPVQDALQGLLRKIEQMSQTQSDITGVASGFETLDHMTGGFQPGDFIIIAARPSMGKTAFSLNIAHHVSSRLKKTVAFFSLEMSQEALLYRLLAIESGLNVKKIRSGQLTEAGWSKLIEAAAVLNEAPLYVNDHSQLSPTELRSHLRRLKSRQGLDLVIIDYLQLMKMREKVENREREVAEISRSLKAVAKELNVPIIALAQLNRNLENRAEKKPMLSDLRESGAIEQDADVILMLYREDYYDRENPDVVGKSEVIIGKQRNGPTGSVPFSFDAQTGRFRDVNYQNPYTPKIPRSSREPERSMN